MRLPTLLMVLLLATCACTGHSSADAFSKACDMASQSADQAASGDKAGAGVTMTKAARYADDARSHGSGDLQDAADDLYTYLWVDAQLGSFDDPQITRICDSI